MSYPQHDALKALNGANQIIGDFIEWLHENDLEICERGQHRNGDARFTPTFKGRDNLIAEFFEIDADELSREKDRMLEDFRQVQSQVRNMGMEFSG